VSILLPPNDQNDDEFNDDNSSIASDYDNFNDLDEGAAAVDVKFIDKDKTKGYFNQIKQMGIDNLNMFKQLRIDYLKMRNKDIEAKAEKLEEK
jgi:hypothetical protein